MSDFEYDYLGSLAKRNAILLAKSQLRRDYLKLLAQAYQCVIIAENIDEDSEIDPITDIKMDVSESANTSSFGRADLLLVDLCTNMEIDAQELSQISSYLIKHQIEAVVWTGLDDLDEVYALLPASQCHFLVDSNPLEAMPAMSGLTGREVMSHLSDISEDESHGKEYAALHRISGELASLAKTLSEIAVVDDMTLSETKHSDAKPQTYSDHDDYMNHSVFKDKPVSFKPFPTKNDQATDTDAANNSTRNIGFSGEKSPFIEDGRELSNSAITADMVKKIIKLRRMRDNFFESELFADPAWDILLDLMAARLSNATVSVSSLCIAAAVPATTGLRWITSMTKNGMLVRKSDPMDARRVFIDLSDETFDKLEAYLIKAQSGGGSII